MDAISNLVHTRSPGKDTRLWHYPCTTPALPMETRSKFTCLCGVAGPTTGPTNRKNYGANTGSYANRHTVSRLSGGPAPYAQQKPSLYISAVFRQIN